MVRDNISLIPYGEDPLDLVAQHILDDYSEQLPDLTRVVVLLSEQHAAKSLRHKLYELALQKGYPALLCPRISNLRQWVTEQYPLKQPVCAQHQRELILYDALKNHQHLLGNGSPWHLTQDLLKLFDQLTSHNIDISHDYETFKQHIASAYGVNDKTFSALGQEANLVHTLWHAWHTQLTEENKIDSEAAYSLALNNSLDTQQFVYIAGYHLFNMPETTFIKHLLKANKCQLYLHGQVNHEPDDYHPDTTITQILESLNTTIPPALTVAPYSAFVNRVYEQNTTTFVQRAEEFSSIHPDPVKDYLSTYMAKSNEEQARSIDIQIRKWLLEDKKHIGIVTENRRLARRVRALLERANVQLDDYAGWTLSTTRVGAVTERLLECIEENFEHTALLDILKSPFIFNDLDNTVVKQAAYRLEHDIILQENIAQGLQRYRKHLQLRQEKLNWSTDTVAILVHILDRLEQAEKILRPLTEGQHPVQSYFNALNQALDSLQMLPLLNSDAAGKQLLEMLEALKHSAQDNNILFSWSDFRTWLGRALEQYVFTPENKGNPVVLMGLSQSRLQKFDAIIIASAEQEHLPGQIQHTPFFNNAVRMQLGLASQVQARAERFHHFRRLLESAPEILITATNEDNGEPVPLSPWLEIFDRFYYHAYHQSLLNTQLAAIVAADGSEVILCPDMSLPDRDLAPSPQLPASIIPSKFSASSYQQLMNCPYQYYVARGLNLSVTEEVQQALSKKDYGERVHLCLQAFHHDIPWLPGPCSLPFDKNNREQAIALLQKISEKVFAHDIDANFEHSGWLEQWQQLIPGYIDWQINTATHWVVKQTEVPCHVEYKGLTLQGRLDRIDENAEGLSVIDYKTGGFARLAEVESGENVQLPFYAFLAGQSFQQPIQQVEFLKLDKEVKSATTLRDEELNNLSHEIIERLETLVKDLNTGSALPAWGDIKTCSYCNMNRICRRQSWDQSH